MTRCCALAYMRNQATTFSCDGLAMLAKNACSTSILSFHKRNCNEAKGRFLSMFPAQLSIVCVFLSGLSYLLPSESFLAHTHPLALSYHEMVKTFNIKQFSGLYYFPCHQNILRAGIRFARRMIVCDYYRCAI